MGSNRKGMKTTLKGESMVGGSSNGGGSGFTVQVWEVLKGVEYLIFRFEAYLRWKFAGNATPVMTLGPKVEGSSFEYDAELDAVARACGFIRLFKCSTEGEVSV